MFTLHMHTHTHTFSGSRIASNPLCAKFVFNDNNYGFSNREMGLLQMMKEIVEFHHTGFVF